MALSSPSHQVIVVTGANGRLGRRICGAFAAEETRVVGTVRSEEIRAQLMSQADAPDDCFTADVTKEDEVEACFDTIGEQVGSIDGLIHTVGTWAKTPFAGTNIDEWERLVAVNLTSTWLCFRHGASLMNSGGRLVAFSSAHGANRGRSEQAAYGATKAGVIRLVESAAEEFGSQSITAHTIAPSYIRHDPSDDRKGVDAADVADLCIYLMQAGHAVNGETIRMG